MERLTYLKLLAIFCISFTRKDHHNGKLGNGKPFIVDIAKRGILNNLAEEVKSFLEFAPDFINRINCFMANLSYENINTKKCTLSSIFMSESQPKVDTVKDSVNATQVPGSLMYLIFVKKNLSELAFTRFFIKPNLDVTPPYRKPNGYYIDGAKEIRRSVYKKLISPMHLF